MRKVCVVLTARTSYTKIKPILVALKQNRSIELQIVCAASAVLDRYGDVSKTVESDGFQISERIYMLLEAETLLTTAKSTGFGIVEFAGTFQRLKPDVVLVMADRYEIIAPAIAAVYQNIPLAHVQGGEISGNIDERVRHAVTKLADIHFPATERSKEWIVRMGENPEKVFLTGCPSIDIAKKVLQEPMLDFDIFKKYGGVGSTFSIDKGFIIVMQHPVTTEVEDARKQANETLHAVSKCNKNVIWFWPNPDAGSDYTSKAIRAFRENHKINNILFIKNMEPFDFLKLLNISEGIIGNSSAAIREGSFLGVPAINIGSRQRNRERGPNVKDVTYDRNEILAAIDLHFKGRAQRTNLYGNGDAGEKIAKILAKISLDFSKSLSFSSKS